MTPKPNNRRKEVIREIHRLRVERNRVSVKAAVISENLPYTPKEIAPVLQDLAAEDLLEAWGNSTPTTFMIEFDPGEVSADLSEIGSD